MKYVHNGISIECSSAEIVSRDIKRNSYMEINSIGKCTTYKCKRNSEAKITKELPHPKEAIHKEDSKLNLHDKIECEDLFLAVNKSKTLKVGIVNLTGRHKAQVANTDCYTFAEISRQIPNIPLAIVA